jgi:hypothetical protein
MFSGPADNMMPKKFDPRVAAIIIAMSIVGAMTIIGDRIAFVREPRNAFETIVAIPTSMFYHFFEDRFYSNLTAAMFWTAVVLITGGVAYHLIVRKVIEPMVIKNMIETKRREKELINKYGDDTL